MSMTVSRRDALKVLAAMPAVAGRSATPGKLNVLWLMSDEHSTHAAGWLKNPIIQTPALDALAKRGAAFSSAYCQNPICVPSRASFLTGRMPSNVGVFGNDGGLKHGVDTMGTVFKRAGYVAHWIGKTHWGGESGFDSPHGSDDEVTGAALRHQITRAPADATVATWPASAEGDTATKNFALRFLETNRDKTFFAGVSFRKPHFPFIVQEEFYRLYQDRVEAPKVTPGMVADLPLLSQKEREGYGFEKLNDAQIRKARAVYFGMVTYMDSLIGEILKKVDELGLRENTIIVYTADHGEMAGEHGLWYKNSFYEASASIPLLLSAPKKIKGGTKVEAPVMNMDLFPTLCDLCGVPAPDGLEGHSLLPLLEGPEGGKDRYALAENFRGGFAGRMIRSGDWKYCYFHEDREQLFDLRNDPGEVMNLAGRPQHKDLQASLKARALKGWRWQERFERKRNKRNQKS